VKKVGGPGFFFGATRVFSKVTSKKIGQNRRVTRSS